MGRQPADGGEKGLSQMPTRGGETPGAPFRLPSCCEVGLRSSRKISPDFGFPFNLTCYYLILFFRLVPERKYALNEISWSKPPCPPPLSSD